jgi:hypothetical protein
MVGLTALTVGAHAARSDHDQLVTGWNWLGGGASLGHETSDIRMIFQ